MRDHLLIGRIALAYAISSAAVSSPPTRIRLLPEVIDISFILTGAGRGGLLGAAYGSLRGDDPDLVARRSLHGTLLVGGATALLLPLLLLVTEVI